MRKENFVTGGPMRRLMSAVAFLGASSLTVSAYAEDWVLRVTTTSRACHVQLKTADRLGADMDGPFTTEAAACKAALRAYDSQLSDPSKCWTYGGGTVKGCNAAGVTLPSK